MAYVVLGETNQESKSTRRRFVLSFGGGEIGIVADGLQLDHHNCKWRHKDGKQIRRLIAEWKVSNPCPQQHYCTDGAHLVHVSKFAAGKTICNTCAGSPVQGPKAIYTVVGAVPAAPIQKGQGQRLRFVFEWSPGVFSAISEGAAKYVDHEKSILDRDGINAAIRVWKESHPGPQTHYYCMCPLHDGNRTVSISEYATRYCRSCSRRYHKTRYRAKASKQKMAKKRKRREISGMQIRANTQQQQQQGTSEELAGLAVEQQQQQQQQGGGVLSGVDARQREAWEQLLAAPSGETGAVSGGSSSSSRRSGARVLTLRGDVAATVRRILGHRVTPQGTLEFLIVWPGKTHRSWVRAEVGSVVLSALKRYCEAVAQQMVSCASNSTLVASTVGGRLMSSALGSTVSSSSSFGVEGGASDADGDSTGATEVRDSMEHTEQEGAFSAEFGEMFGASPQDDGLGLFDIVQEMLQPTGSLDGPFSLQ